MLTLKLEFVASSEARQIGIGTWKMEAYVRNSKLALLWPQHTTIPNTLLEVVLFDLTITLEKAREDRDNTALTLPLSYMMSLNFFLKCSILIEVFNECLKNRS